MKTLCRDCGRQPPLDAEACPACGSVRVVRHQELHDLAIAHLDCDAFYAAIEKRDRPELRDVPARVGEAELVARYGKIGKRLSLCARGEDERPVNPDRETKSMSSETCSAPGSLDTSLSHAAGLIEIAACHA